MFSDCVIFMSVNIHTSVFFGIRLEINIIAKKKPTYLLRLYIMDYFGDIIIAVEYFEKERVIILNVSAQITE